MNCKILFYFAPVLAAAFVVVPTVAADVVVAATFVVVPTAAVDVVVAAVAPAVAVDVVVATAFVVVATEFIADTTLVACFSHTKSSVTHVEEPLHVKHD